MKLRESSVADPRSSLLQVELVKIIDMSHPLAVLAGEIDGEAFGNLFCENSGIPGKPVRLMAGLHCLRHAFNFMRGKLAALAKRWGTHGPASLYETFAPEEAKEILERLEIHYTPRHGS